MIPQWIRDWFGGNQTGVFTSPSNPLLWILRLLFVILTVGIATRVFALENAASVPGFFVILIIGLVVIALMVVGAAAVARVGRAP